MTKQHKGGRSPDGSPAKSADKKINSNWAVRQSLKRAIAELPQVKSGEWSQSYFVEQVLLNCLELPAEYDIDDLDQILNGAIVE